MILIVMKINIKNIGEFFKWLILTNIGRLILAFIWVLTFTGISNNINSDWAFQLSLIGVAYLIGFTIIMIIYAWVINPIRERKKLKNK